MTNRRRGIIGLSCFSCGLLGGVALYQLGILKKLPQPPLRGFNSAKVHKSTEAYPFGVPDALLGLGSCAVTAALAAVGSPIMLGCKLLADAAAAGKLTLDECTKIRAFSIWSLLVTASTLAALPLAYGEVSRRDTLDGIEIFHSSAAKK